MKVYDRFADEYIDESEMDEIAPPERYEYITEDLLIDNATRWFIKAFTEEKARIRNEREEAIRTLKEHKITFQHDFGWNISVLKALDLAIEALEQQPCEDAISREQAIKECYSIPIDGETFDVVQVETLMGLPPVTPKQKIDKLPVIYRDDGTYNPPMFEKALCPSCEYELGKLWGYPFCPKCGQALEWEESE